MNRTKREIESLLMPPAGLSAHSDARGSAANCMVFDERPSTPEEIRKYRRSANLEPGKRFQNPKTVMDLQTLQLEQKTFGISSKTSESNAAALLKQVPAGTVEKLNFIKSENIYFTTKREPLGKVYSRHHQLPQKYIEGISLFPPFLLPHSILCR
jgi:EF-hand domain-containing family member B